MQNTNRLRIDSKPRSRKLSGEVDVDAYLTEIERLRSESERKPREPALPVKKVQAVEEAIARPRHQANYGEVCNPWLDDGAEGFRYAPLLDWIALRTDLTSGEKKFYAALLYRARMCRDWLRADKLAEETGNSTWKVNHYIREFKARELIRGRFEGELHLVGPLRAYLDKPLMNDSAYNKLHKSRIPQRLMSYGNISDQAVIVYGRLCGLAGKKGWSFHTNDKLAEACGISVKTLRVAVRQLEDEKLIRVGRYGRGNGSGRRPTKPGGEALHGGGQNTYYFLGHKLFRLRKVKSEADWEPQAGVPHDWRKTPQERS